MPKRAAFEKPGHVSCCRPSDDTVSSVANNNVACVKGVKDLFESYKRYAVALFLVMCCLPDGA